MIIDIDLNAELGESPFEKREKLKKERENLIDEIKQSQFKYFLEDSSDKTLYNICYFYMYAEGDKVGKINKVVNSMKFSILFLEDKNWDKEIENKFKTVSNKYNKDENVVYHFILEKEIQEYIKQEDLIIPSKGNIQKIKREEVLVMFRSIIFNLIKSKKESKDLRQSYFLSPTFIEKFKKETKRNLNSPKLSRITKLLCDADLIKKEYVHSKGNIKDTITFYSIGNVGFYAKRLNKN